jgi:hypothetical protein
MYAILHLRTAKMGWGERKIEFEKVVPHIHRMVDAGA